MQDGANNVTFSVIIPTYETENLIKIALNSIVEQSFPDDQIQTIVIDDGSKPQTQNNLEKIIRAYPQVDLILAKENKGPGGAYNTGLDNATGEWIVFLDSDDALAANALDMLARTIQTNPSADIIPYNWRFLDGTNTNSLRKEGRRDEEFFTTKDSILQEYLKLRIDASTIFCVRRQMLEKNALRFEEGYHEDIDFLFKAYFHAREITYLNAPLYQIYDRPGSIVNSFSMRHFRGYKRAFDDIEKFLSEQEQTDEVSRLRPALAQGVIGGIATRLRQCVRSFDTADDALPVFEAIQIFVNQWKCDPDFGFLVRTGETLYPQMVRLFIEEVDKRGSVANACANLFEAFKALDGKSWSTNALHHGLYVNEKGVFNQAGRHEPELSQFLKEGELFEIDLFAKQILRAKQALFQKINAGLENPYAGHADLEFQNWTQLNELKLTSIRFENSFLNEETLIQKLNEAGMIADRCEIEGEE